MVPDSAVFRADLTCNGVTQDIPVEWKFLDDSHLKVLLTTVATNTSATLVLGSDYTVTGAGVEAGGIVHTTVAYSSAYRISVVPDVPFDQSVLYTEGEKFPAKSHEGALDKLTLLVRQLKESVTRCVRGAENVSTNYELPPPEVGSALGWVSSTALGNVPNNAVGLSADLADYASASKGAGMSGFAYALTYAANTVGKAIKDVMDRATALESNEEPVGQCQFNYVNSTTCRLDRKNGRFLTIGGVRRAIAATGPTLSSSGLSAGTLYYVYAYWTGTDVVLEASTTGHATDATTGVEIKSGASSRTLVGAVYVLAGPVFANSETQRLVASWFNRRPILATAYTTADRTSTSVNPTYTEFHTEARIEFVSWANDAVQFGLAGGAKVAATSYTGIVSIAVDTLTSSVGAVDSFAQTTTSCGAGGAGSKALSEGRHLATISGAVSSAGTVTLNSYSRISATIMQ